MGFFFLDSIISFFGYKIFKEGNFLKLINGEFSKKENFDGLHNDEISKKRKILMAYISIFWRLNLQIFLFWKYLMDYVIRSCDFLKIKMESAYVSGHVTY